MKRDFSSARYKGEQKGPRKGRQEGRQEERRSVVKNLLRKKMPYDDIVDVTGLSLEEVKRLAADLEH